MNNLQVAQPATSAKASALAFTIATSAAPLTKTFTLRDDGKPCVSRSAGLLAGSARRETLTGTADDMAEQLAGLLSSLSANEALIPAAPPAGRDVWQMTTKSEAAGRSDVIARTKEYFAHTAGTPALLALDLDTKGYPRDVLQRIEAAGGLSAVFAAVFPPMREAACVTRRSVSSYIRRKSKPADKGEDSGQHRYFLATDGADVADFARRLGDQLMLAGWCWGEVSQSGRVLIRTLVDVTASNDPSRLFYEADAILDHADLEYNAGRRKPNVAQGGFVDTRLLAPLSPAESDELQAIKAAAVAKCAPEAMTRRKEWLEARGTELVTKGVAPELAQQVLKAASGQHELMGDFPIHLDSGEVVTVREILSGGKKYHKATCADPLEPGYGDGHNLAIIYTDNRPHIWSHAHGGIDYALVSDPDNFFSGSESDGGADDGGWPEPLDVFGDGDPAALMDVPAGALPDIVDRYARDLADRMGAPVPFTALSAIVTLSAAIGGSIQIQPKANDTSWTEYPFLWGLLVENPGGKKTPVMSAVTAPLVRLDARRSAQDVPKRQAWEMAAKSRKRGEPPSGPPPRLRRSSVDSFTGEALRDVLAANPKGVLVVADELTGTLAGLDQYKTRGGSERADLLRLPQGGPRTIDRVSGSVRVPCWGASVIGGVQPKKLAEIAHTLDSDGLLQRFIVVVGDNERRPGVDRAPDAQAVSDYEAAVTGLAESEGHVLFEASVVLLSPEAQAVRQRFERRIDALMNMPQMSDAWSGHLSKWVGFFPRLMLVFHMVDGWSAHGIAAAGLPVSGETAERVWRFSEFLLRHAVRFYETVVGMGAAADAARRVAGVILVNGMTSQSQRDIYNRHQAWRPQGRPIHPELAAAMTTLGRLGWCRPKAPIIVAPTDWDINPAVFILFKDRAAAEAERRRREYERVQVGAAERRAIMARGAI